MPQLDHFSFFSQVFWVLLFFTIFYFLNVRQTLPSLVSILKVRRRIFQKSQNSFNNIQPKKTEKFFDSHTYFFAVIKIYTLPLNHTLKIGRFFNKLRSINYIAYYFDKQLKKTSSGLKVSNSLFLFVKKIS
jgi:hypothetical protein